MVDKYIELRNRLNLLGYTQNFPVEATSLIENLSTDLIQTTKSLQYYMTLSKEAIQQRDSLKNIVEPYKCENLNLVQENNELQKILSEFQSETDRRLSAAKNKIVKLEHELERCEAEITKLKLEKRELKTISSYTASAAKKSAVFNVKFSNQEAINARKALKSKKYCKCNIPTCPCFDELAEEIEELTDSLNTAEDRCSRLEAMKNRKGYDWDHDLHKTISKLRQSENLNEQLSEKLRETVANQHEAMLRALKLADKNSLLENELKTIDTIALQVESECNKILKEKCTLIAKMKKQLAVYEDKRSVMTASKETQMSSDDSFDSSFCTRKKKSSSVVIRKPKKKSSKLITLSSKPKVKAPKSNVKTSLPQSKTQSIIQVYQSKDEVHNMFEEEKKKYEQKLKELTEQLQNGVGQFNNKNFVVNKCIDTEETKTTYEKQNMKEFQSKICELETIINDVKIENRFLKGLVNTDCQKCIKTHGKKGPLGKDDLSWSAEYLRDSNKNFEIYGKPMCVGNCRNDGFRLQKEVQARDARIEMLLEENGMLKMTRDTKKSSYSHLRSEVDDMKKTVHILNEELADIKCVNTQLKNLQKQTEKHMVETQGELAEAKKMLKNSKVMIAHLEKRNKMLQEELGSLTNERKTMKQNLSLIDGERDRLIMECDNKTEAILEKDSKLSMMESELKSMQAELAKVCHLERDSSFKLNITNNKFENMTHELKSIFKEKDHLIKENKALQEKLASVRAEHLAYIEKCNRSNVEVDSMKQQLQVYVSKIKTVEDVLQSKEEEMKTLLENFSSLAQEATALEMTNNSLEHECALKCTEANACLQKVNTIDSQLKSAEETLNKKDEQVAALTVQIKSLEGELLRNRNIKEDLQQKEMYSNDVVNTLKMQNKNLMSACEDLRGEKIKMEQHIDYLNDIRRHLEESIQQGRTEIEALDDTLVKSRREIVDLKVSLQNAMTESNILKEKIIDITKRLQNIDFDAKESRQRADSAIQQMMDLQKFLYARENADARSDKSERSSTATSGRKGSV